MASRDVVVRVVGVHVLGECLVCLTLVSCERPWDDLAGLERVSCPRCGAQVEILEHTVHPLVVVA